jgi:hypothetical protein
VPVVFSIRLFNPPIFGGFFYSSLLSIRPLGAATLCRGSAPRTRAKRAIDVADMTRALRAYSAHVASVFCEYAAQLPLVFRSSSV